MYQATTHQKYIVTIPDRPRHDLRYMILFAHSLHAHQTANTGHTLLDVHFGKAPIGLATTPTTILRHWSTYTATFTRVLPKEESVK